MTPPLARELLQRAASEPRHRHQAAAGTCGDVRREANMAIPWSLVVISQASACALALLRITHTSTTSHRPAASKTAVWAACFASAYTSDYCTNCSDFRCMTLLRTHPFAHPSIQNVRFAILPVATGVSPNHSKQRLRKARAGRAAHKMSNPYLQNSYIYNHKPVSFEKETYHACAFKCPSSAALR